MTKHAYAKRIRALLSPAERRLFKRLNTPIKIQNYLESLPVNFETRGETYMSPRRMIEAGTAHCFEAALFAAAILAYHGKEPLLLDIQSLPDDEDHVVALFQVRGKWGAFSKTNHNILRYRDAVYANPRELAMSYFHEYLMDDGRKSMCAFSKPFDLSRYSPERWVTASDDLHWLVEAVDNAKHFPAASKKALKGLRRGSPIERRALRFLEWQRPRLKKKRR